MRGFWLAAASLAYLLLAGTSSAVSIPRAPATVVIRVNQVGFRPDDSKRGLVMATGVIHQAKFDVVDASGGLVLSGSVGARLPTTWSSTYPDVYPIDFSSLRTPGSYRLRLVGASPVTSPVFRVGSGAALYEPLLANAVAFFQSQRDGAAVVASVLSRRPAHLNDRRALVYATPRYGADGLLHAPLVRIGGPLNVVGGWFDAGDYIKLVETASYADVVLLMAARDHAAAFPVARGAASEARVGTDWLFRLWDDRRRTLAYQVGIGDGNGVTILGDHDLWRLPQADDALRVRPGDPRWFLAHRPVFATRPGVLLSPNLAGRVSAAFALCAQVFRTSAPAYAKRCLLAGEHVFARAQTRHVRQLVTAEPYAYYPESEWRDDLELGAAELARALAMSGAPHDRVLAIAYRDQAVHWARAYIRARGAASDSLNLYDVSALAHAELVDVDRMLTAAPARAEQLLLGDLRAQLTAGLRQAATDPFGVGVAYASVDAVPHALGYAVTADAYHRLTGSPMFDAFAQQQVDWVLGVNAWGSSFVVGAGRVFPHCMQSQIANLSGSLTGTPPLQLGATVDGPSAAANFTGLGVPSGARTCPPRPSDPFRVFSGHGARFMDDVRSWPSVEPTDDYTALTLLVFANRITS